MRHAQGVPTIFAAMNAFTCCQMALNPGLLNLSAIGNAISVSKFAIPGFNFLCPKFL
jgi:hypothetical protein